MSRNLALVQALESIAQKHEATPAQIALAWVLGKDQAVPIPGTRRIKYLNQNTAAAEIKLGEDDKKLLEKVFDYGEVAGPRYPEEGMKGVSS